MCHIFETDHYFDEPPREPLYKPAAPGQNMKRCATPSEAKFWREAQEKPTHWIIRGESRGFGCVVTRISHHT